MLNKVNEIVLWALGLPGKPAFWVGVVCAYLIFHDSTPQVLMGVLIVCLALLVGLRKKEPHDAE